MMIVFGCELSVRTNDYGNWTWKFRKLILARISVCRSFGKMERSPDAPNADFQLCRRMSSTN